MITEDEVMRLLERADPARHVDAAPAVDAGGYLDALRKRSTTVTFIDTEPTPTRPPRRRWPIIAAAAAAVVAVVVGGLVLAVRDDADEPQIPAGPSTVAPDSAAAEAEQVARSLFEAENAYDADRALTYLSDEFVAAEFGTPEQYRLNLSFSEAVSDKRLNIDCEQQGESAAGIVLRCTYDYHSFRSDEIGRGPYTGDYKDLTIRDGKIVAVEAHYEGLTSGFSTQMWVPFANWVAAEHPDDVLRMYEDATRTGWRITEESIPLWEQHLREYVEAENGGVGFIGLPPEGATPSTPDDRHRAIDIALSGLARGDDLEDVAARLEPLHPRHDTFPGEVLLDLAADAIGLCGADRLSPLEFEGIRERHLPDGIAHTKAQHHKSKFALRAAATLRGGVDPGLLDEVQRWRSDDLWYWSMEALAV